MQEFKQFDLEIDYQLENGYGLDISSRKQLSKLIDDLNNCYVKDMNSFADICYVVKQIKDLFDKFNKENLNYYAYVRDLHQTLYRFDDIMKGFGIDKSQSSRLLSSFDKYIEVIDNKARVKIIFLPFSKSKLFELLVVDTKQLESDILNKVLLPHMTIKSIRDYIKNYRNIVNSKHKLKTKIIDDIKSFEELIEEDIPMAYDPKQHYDFNYFENKTKSQLLNMIWDLQKEYERLKKEK